MASGGWWVAVTRRGSCDRIHQRAPLSSGIVRQALAEVRSGRATPLRRQLSALWPHHQLRRIRSPSTHRFPPSRWLQIRTPHFTAYRGPRRRLTRNSPPPPTSLSHRSYPRSSPPVPHPRSPPPPVDRVPRIRMISSAYTIRTSASAPSKILTTPISHNGTAHPAKPSTKQHGSAQNGRWKRKRAFMLP